jgi:hypothetical protein
MIQSAIVEQILGAIFGFQYLVDIVLGIFLLVAFAIGFKRGLWRSLWRLIFVVLTLVLVNLFAMPALGEFINEGFWSLTGMSVTIDLGGTPYVFNSLESIVVGFSEYAEAAGTLSASSLFADPAFLTEFSLGIAKAIGWIAVIFVTMLLSWPVSGLLWLIIWRPLLKSVSKTKVKFLGGVFGLAQGYVYALLMAITFSPLTNGLAAIQNPTEAPYAFGTVIPLIASGFRPENSLLFSIADPSNPFGFFSNVSTFEFDGTEYNLVETFVDFIEATDTPAS